MTDQLTDKGVAVLQAALDRAEKKPKRFNMKHWFTPGKAPETDAKFVEANVCGTTACLAGHIVLADPRYVIRGTVEVSDGETFWYYEPVNLEDLTIRSWESAAMESLGINSSHWGEDEIWSKVYNLFMSTDLTLDEVWLKANRISGDRLTLPERLR